MSTETTAAPSDAAPAPTPVAWLSVLLFAAVMAYADGFWMTSLEGAIGAIERTQSPFSTWFRSSTLLLPVFAVVVLFALRVARRRAGGPLRRPRAVLATTMLVALAGTAVGVGALVVNSVYDYHLQARQIAVLHAATGDHSGHGEHSGHGDHSAPVGPTSRDARCVMLHETRDAHVRGVQNAAPLLLLTNVVGAAWVVALRGGEIDPDPARAERRRGAGRLTRRRT